MKKSLFLIGMLISFGSVNGSEAALPRCDAYRKSVQCLTESINRFTDKSFSIMNLLAVRQSADLMSAVSKNISPVISFPMKSNLDIDFISIQYPHNKQPERNKTNSINQGRINRRRQRQKDGFKNPALQCSRLAIFSGHLN